MRSVKLCYDVLQRNVEAFCNKQNSQMRDGASSVSRDQQTPPLTAVTYSILSMLHRRNVTTRDGPAPAVINAKARYWSKIAIFRSWGSPSEYCHKVWYWETMVWLPDGEKKLEFRLCLFLSTEYMNVADTQTDGQTPHDGIGRAYA